MTVARSHQGRAEKSNRNVTSIHCVGYARRPRLLSITLGLPVVGLQRHVDQNRFICSITKRVEALRSVLPGQVSGTNTQEVKALPTVKVRICIQHQVPFGQVLKVVGVGPQLGDWQPSRARELQWTEGHIWVVDLVLEPGTYELKCVSASGDNIFAWEGGANRILQVPDGVKGIRVDGSWSQTASNRVTVTEPISAASQAARQKRAAAARLLYKALAEVNAAVARAEASGVVSSPRQAAPSVPAESTHNPASETETQNEARKESLPAAGPLTHGPDHSDISAADVGSKATTEQLQKEDRAGSGVVERTAISHTLGNSTTAALPAVDRQEESPERSSTTHLSPTPDAASVSPSRGSFVLKDLDSALNGAEAALCKAADAPARAPKETPQQEPKQQPQQWPGVELQDALAGIGKSIQQAAEDRGEPPPVSPAHSSAVQSDDAASGNGANAQPSAGASQDRGVVVEGKQAAPAAQSSLGTVARATAEKRGTVSTAASLGDGRGLIPAAAQETPQGGSQAFVEPTAASRSRFSFASLLGRLEDIQKREGRKEAGPGSQTKAVSSAEDRTQSAIKPASKEDATSTAADSIGTGGVSAAGGSSSVDGSTSRSRSHLSSWRRTAEDLESTKVEPVCLAKESVPSRQNQLEGQETPEQQPQASPAAEVDPDPEQGASSRFARLLNNKLKQRQRVAEQTELKQEDTTVAPSQDSVPKPSVPAEKAIGAASAEIDGPATPDGRDIRSAYDAAATTPSERTITHSAETSAPSSSVAASDNKEATDKSMGGTGSRPVADSNLAQYSDSADLHRLLDVWDAAWSMGGERETVSSTASAAGSRPPLVTLQANGGVTSTEGYRSATASADGSSAGDARSRSDLTGPLGTRAAAAAGVVNGGAAAADVSSGSGPSSGESLYSRAERLTANGSGNLPIEFSSGDSSQDGITVRKGAMAAMGVDRQGSIDNRSSYLSQSLLAQDSLGGSSSNGVEQSSSALLRQLRAVNEANAAAASASPPANDNESAVGSKAAPATTNGPIPPLPATPAPNGILSKIHDDDEEEVAPPLPATPPPPSYLSSSPAPVVPPLPATPVPKSVLSGLKGGISNAAEDLLRRATDADAVLDMLRGNLPLTPIARGGRGGAAGPLSLVEDDADEVQDGASGNTRKRRPARPANGTRPSQGQSNGLQADPVAATRAALAGAAQAWDNTRSALQQGAAGLGLSPNALSESATRLLQQLPKIDMPQQPSAPALPPAVTKIATSLGWGLGNGTGGAQGQGKTGEAGVEGSTTATGPSTAVEGDPGTAPGGDAPGSLRLVAGAHMIPHVDKVDKGGEDAYFISRVGLGGVAVADGVSGWADEGIDPAEYPRTLMRFATDAYEAARGAMSSQDIIRYAQYRTYLKGSSTVCMALMKPWRKLEIANVGDSGVRILRGGKVIFGTEAQQHSFNMPYQLSHPNNVEDPDSADDADVHLLDVQEGDVVMLATDGLFDNVFDAEIEQIVSQQLRELATAGRGKPPVAAGASEPLPSTNSGASAGSSSSNGQNGGRSGGAGGAGGRGLLSQSLNAAANCGGRVAGGQYRPEDAARVARALAERAHLHARNPTQRTPWSVTSSQQPNFMWAKFFAKGGGKMDDCTVLVAFVCGPE